MSVVVDANVVLSCLLRDGWTRHRFLTTECTLIAPEALRDEVLAQAEMVRSRANLEADEFEALLEVLLGRIQWVAGERIADRIEVATKAVGAADPKDVPYAACALAVGADGIWSFDDDLDRGARLLGVA